MLRSIIGLSYVQTATILGIEVKTVQNAYDELVKKARPVARFELSSSTLAANLIDLNQLGFIGTVTTSLVPLLASLELGI